MRSSPSATIATRPSTISSSDIWMLRLVQRITAARRLIVIVSAAACLAIVGADARADEGEEEELTGLEWLAFPTFKGNSDAGFIAGAQLQMVDYDDGTREPFAWELRLKLNVGFKPDARRQEHFFVFDTPHLLPGKLRWFLQAEFLQIPDAHYYGVGNETEMLGDAELNDFRLTEPRIQTHVRRELGPLDTFGGVTLAFASMDAEPDSLLAQQQLLGYEGGRNVSGVIGVVYDTRDSEIVTRRGIQTELYSRFALTPLSEYSWFGGGASASFFYAPVEWIVFAQRTMFEALGGAVPLSEMYRIGGMRNVRGIGGVFSQRGFKEGRFIGPIKGLANFEVRGYFEPIFQHLRFGAGPFLDVSRVFDGTGTFLRVWHVSSGGEFTINWKETFLFRLDYAVSAEGGEFYIEGRHIF